METNNLYVIKCEYCGREFSGRYAKASLRSHNTWCQKKYKFIEQYQITKEKLEFEYDNLGSVLQFKEHYPYWNDIQYYYRLFREFEIDVSVKKAANNINVKKHRENTCLKKSGFRSNLCKNHPNRIKWEKKLLDTEGITNVFQRESVKESIIKTIIERYGSESWKGIKTIRGDNIISSINKKIFELLTDNKIDFKIEYKIQKTSKSYYSYDILIGNKIIEINGDYWHGNPKIYKPSDLILKNTAGECLVSDKWKFDKVKIDFAISKGHEILIIWEYDIKNNYEHVKQQILNYARS